MMTYFLSLGSNINAKENLDFAQSELNKILINTKSSTIHKTKAEGFEGDDFLNSIICGEIKDSFDVLNNNHCQTRGVFFHKRCVNCRNDAPD